MGYNEFVKYMFRMGFNWTDIEYYWRHQNELKELLASDKKLSKEEQKQKALNKYVANI